MVMKLSNLPGIGVSAERQENYSVWGHGGRQTELREFVEARGPLWEGASYNLEIRLKIP